MDILSEVQREIIYDRVWDAERIARKYILKVLELVIGESLFEEKVFASFFVTPSVISDEHMFKGPIHMAQIYA